MNLAERAQVVIKVVGGNDADGERLVGMYLREINYFARDGMGEVRLCEFWSDARRFDSEEDAAEFLVTISPVRPEVNGKVYRPAMWLAYSFKKVGPLYDTEIGFPGMSSYARPDAKMLH